MVIDVSRYLTSERRFERCANRMLMLMAGLFCTVFMLLVQASFVIASEARLAQWDDLVPSVEAFDDPFTSMSLDQKSDLRDVLKHREARQDNREDPVLAQKAEAAEARLEAAGLDPDYLLAQRLVVMERRREEATGTTSAFLEKDVLMDGYVLPLSWEGERVVEFLLVPWVGACIHTPPPPPNQIVHVVYPEGMTLEKRFEAVRLEGVLRHRPAEHALFLLDGNLQVPASYALDGATISGSPGEIVAASASEVPFLTMAQIWINDLFTSGMSQIGNEGSAKAVFAAVLMAFGYGALHTLGPGHGKAVVISYFVGTGGSLRRGLTMGVRIAVFHVLSAIVVVFLLDLVVRQATGSAPSDYRTIRLFSYALIMTIGVVMLWQAIRFARLGSSHESVHDHRHDHVGHDHHSCLACGHHPRQRGGGWVAAAVGVVPCTGALIVMLFGLANDLLWPAILMVIAISAGMAVAMAALGVTALWGRAWAERRFATGHSNRTRFKIGARFLGASCVLAIGAVLFVATLNHGASVPQVTKEIADMTEAATTSGG